MVAFQKTKFASYVFQYLQAAPHLIIATSRDDAYPRILIFTTSSSAGCGRSWPRAPALSPQPSRPSFIQALNAGDPRKAPQLA
jgi:hypothetical protein